MNLVDFITALDGPRFVGLCLLILVVSVAIAAVIAREPQEPAHARRVSSNRKAARR